MSNVMNQSVPAAASAAFSAASAWHAVSAPVFATTYGPAVVTRAIDTSGTTNPAVKRTAHLVTSRASSPPV